MQTVTETVSYHIYAISDGRRLRVANAEQIAQAKSRPTVDQGQPMRISATEYLDIDSSKVPDNQYGAPLFW